jgi:curved DNA-binding protein CbpA
MCRLMKRDFYQVLGVARDASPAEIRTTYIRLVKRHHPDHSGSLPSRLRDVQQAYRCLADPARRAEHDHSIADAERAHHARQRSIQRRLGHYDSRHPSPPARPGRPGPWPWRDKRWRTMLIATIGVGIVARISLGLF